MRRARANASYKFDEKSKAKLEAEIAFLFDEKLTIYR